MSVFSTKILRVAALGAAILCGGQAAATTITFDTWSSTGPILTDPVVTVNDDTSGVLTFNVTTTGLNGNISGIWIDLAGDPSYAESGITVLTTGYTVLDYTEDGNSLGNGRNLNGGFVGPDFNGSAGSFDIGFGFEDGANPPRQAPVPVAFTLDTIGGTFTLDSIERIALRFQSIPSGPGSEKLIGVPPSPVPLPAGLVLLLGAMGGLGMLRARRRIS